MAQTDNPFLDGMAKMFTDAAGMAQGVRAEIDTFVKQRLERLGLDGVERHGKRLEALKSLLRALGPESAFQRGFSITLDEKGDIVRSVGDVAPGGLMRTKLADGEVASRVEK